MNIPDGWIQPIIRVVPNPETEFTEEQRKYIGEDKFNKPIDNILEVPFYLKLVAPSLMHHYPDLIQFLRHDVRKYPKVMVLENSPHPYPFMEVYNIAKKQLYEVDITFKTRQQLNKLMRDFNQLPMNCLERLDPTDCPLKNQIQKEKEMIKSLGIGTFP